MLGNICVSVFVVFLVAVGSVKSTLWKFLSWTRGGSRTAETSKMEHFVIIVNDWKPLTIIRKSSVLDVAAVLDSPLWTVTQIYGKSFVSDHIREKFCLNLLKIWKAIEPLSHSVYLSRKVYLTFRNIRTYLLIQKCSCSWKTARENCFRLPNSKMFSFQVCKKITQ